MEDVPGFTALFLQSFAKQLQGSSATAGDRRWDWPAYVAAAVAVGAALGILRRRSLVVIVSDFLSEPGWQGPLGRLARRHDVVAIQVVDRREFELPPAGMIYSRTPRPAR